MLQKKIIGIVSGTIIGMVITTMFLDEPKTLINLFLTKITAIVELKSGSAVKSADPSMIDITATAKSNDKNDLLLEIGGGFNGLAIYYTYHVEIGNKGNDNDDGEDEGRNTKKEQVQKTTKATRSDRACTIIKDARTKPATFTLDEFFDD